MLPDKDERGCAARDLNRTPQGIVPVSLYSTPMPVVK